MCRHAAYAGPPLPLSALLYDPPHALERQAYAPRSMVRGTVNVDGTGICWWAGDAEQPLRYVSDAPPWSDANLPGLAPRLTARMMLATVRSATPGTPHGASAALPFATGRLASTLNGFLENFAETFARPLAASLSDAAFARYEVASDALVVHLLLADRRNAHPDEPLAASVAHVVTDVARRAAEAGLEASLNLAAADGRSLAAARCAHGVPSNGLHVIDGGARWPGGALLASEPLDDDAGWREVPDGRVAAWQGEAWQIVALDDALGVS